MRYLTLQEYSNLLDVADKNNDLNKDNSKIYQFLKQMTYVNPRIKGCINTRKAGVISWGYKIVADEKNNIGKADQAFKRLSPILNKVINKIMDIPIFGLFCIELLWELGDAGMAPKIKKMFDLQEIEFMQDGGILIKSKPSLGNKTTKMIVNENPNFLVGGDIDGGVGGQLRSVGYYEILRNEMLLEWSNYNKKLKGIIHAVEHGADDDEKNAAIGALKSVVKNNYLLTSDLVDFQFHNITASSPESFKEIIEHLNNSIAIALLGQANTNELPQGGGSRAALQVQATISADLMYSDVQIVEEIINNQLLRHDYQLNYGNNSNIPYRFIIDTTEAEDAEKSIIVIREAINAGIPLLEAEVYDKIGFTIPSPDDKIFRGVLDSQLSQLS